MRCPKVPIGVFSHTAAARRLLSHALRDLLKQTGIDNILKYAASTLAQEEDNQVVDSLRNFLFGAPGQGGLDLAALNIQRGRDHGLADYNGVREAYGLPRVTSFDQITSNVELQQTLKSLYGSVDDIDLWVGTLAEDHVQGASVGQLAKTIISDQFERLRDGDRFWYQRVFSGRTLADLEQTTLSSIIQRNTTINNLQGNVFFLQAEVGGQVFRDTNANGRQDRTEAAVPGIEVQLLNDEGTVLASTRTGRDGRYKFTSFSETGDYTVRVIPTGRLTAALTDRAVLLSRGGLTVSNVNFGLRSLGRSNLTTDGIASASSSSSTASKSNTFVIDAVFTSMQSTSGQTVAGPRSARLRFGRTTSHLA